jgi:iron complex outermembrane receptor protein
VLRGTDYERRSAVQARLDLGPWTASLLYADRLKGVPFQYYFDTVYGDTRTSWRDTMTQLDAQRVATIGGSEVLGRVYAGQYQFTGIAPIERPPVTLNRDVGIGRWWGVEGRVVTSWSDHKTVLGVEGQRAGELSLRNVDTSPPGMVYLDSNHDAWRGALYVEDRWSLWPQATLTIGARHDRFDNSSPVTSPRLALNLRPSDTVVMKAIHGSAFRTPNINEQFYAVDVPQGFELNSALKPERVVGNELALEWLPAAYTRLAGSLFSTEASELLVQVYDPDTERYQYRNVGSFRAKGLELELERTWRGGSHLRANISWQRDHTEGDAGPVTVFPARMAKLAIIEPLGARWTIATEAQAMSRRGAAPGQAVFNAALATKHGERGLGLSFAVRNVLGRRLLEPGADPVVQPTLPGRGREWQLQVEHAL